MSEDNRFDTNDPNAPQWETLVRNHSGFVSADCGHRDTIEIRKPGAAESEFAAGWYDAAHGLGITGDIERRNQEILRDFVAREIGHCVSSLVHYFASNPESLEGSGYDWHDDILPLCARADWETAAEEWIADASADELAEAADACNLDAEEIQAEALRNAIRSIESDAADADCVSPYAGACEALNGDACGFIAEDTPAAEAGRRVARALRVAILDALDDCDDLDKLTEAADSLLIEPSAEEFRAESLRKALRDDMADESGGADAREVCEAADAGPYEREAYEHWVVSDWLAGKLAERGEMTGELFGLTLWGRCCTGQAIFLDGVMREIASELEILAGQRNDWSKQGTDSEGGDA